MYSMKPLGVGVGEEVGSCCVQYEATEGVGVG